MKLDLVTEERVLRNAIKKGLISEQLLKDIEAEAMNLIPVAEDLSPRFELLLRKGLIEAGVLQALIHEATQETAHPQFYDATLKVDFPESPPQTISSFGRYENLELLGQGGMAIVYKAFDPTLGRLVALKFLRRTDPHYLKRFLMEARLQARINHENICRVYEVGQVEEKPYIAMQYIEGKTLKELAPKLTTLEKATVMKHVADAVHEAHRMGLIHRDLKPANILVERGVDGEWTPYVVDFGIARHVEGSDMTATGLILGTPWYMSPEQASGQSDVLDHRTDVYSLGATMYELLSGRFPFEGTSAQDIFLKILVSDPVTLQQRDPTIPADLQTIVMKCMEKEPSRRYPSAKAVADELDRYIKGDPILARPTGFFSRAYRKARKNRALSITVALGLFLSLTLLTIALNAYWNAQKQTEIAQRFGQQLAKMESGLRSAYLLPLHDVRQDKKKVRAQMNEIEQQMKQLGKSAKAPGYYAIGRGHLALGEYTFAKINLEKAVQKGLNTPEVAHALGLTLGALYRQQLQEAERIQNVEIKKSVIGKIQKQFRDPALEYLKKGETPEYVRALIAFYEKNWKDADRLADEAFQRDSSLYEAKILKGNIHTAIAGDLGNTGQVRPALDQFEIGAKHLSDAIELARSDPAAYSDLCDLRLQQISLLAYQEGENLNVPIKNLVAACDKSLTADPDQGPIHTKKAEAFWLQGRWMMENGNDPATILNEAKKEAQRAISLNAKDGAAYKTAGVASLVQGEYELNQGRDPRKALGDAVENLNYAIQLSANPLAPTNSLGNAYWLLGRYAMDHGSDPTPQIRYAMENYQKAIRIEPKFSTAYGNLALVHRLQAEYKIGHGDDPTSDFKHSIENLEQSIRINPGTSLTYNSLGNTFGELGDYQISVGQDPSDAYKKSIASFDQAEKLDNGWFSPVLNRGITYQSLADYALNHGDDPNDAVRKAIKDYERAIHLNPTYFGTYSSLANAYRTLGRFAIFSGKDPTEYHRLVLESVEKALKANSEDMDSFMAESATHLDRAQYLLSRNQSPLPFLEKAMAALQKAEKLDPTVAEIHIYKAELKLAESRWRSAEKSFQQAFDSLNKAIELNPKSADAYLTRAQYFRRHVEWMKNKGGPEIEQGIAAANEAIKLNPELAEAYGVRGVLYALQGNQTASKKDIHEALRINKNLKLEYSPYL